MTSTTSSTIPATDPAIAYLGLFVEPLAARVRDWLAEGKLVEDDLDRVLSPAARARVDGACEASAATSSPDVETLVSLVAEQLGDEAALSALADEIAGRWLERGPFDGLLRAARSFVDGPGFVASQVAESLVASPDWLYTGGREGFTLRLRGVAMASPASKALLGRLLARLAEGASLPFLDVRIDGVDGGDLVVSGTPDLRRGADPARETRLHRAALAP